MLSLHWKVKKSITKWRDFGNQQNDHVSLEINWSLLRDGLSWRKLTYVHMYIRLTMLLNYSMIKFWWALLKGSLCSEVVIKGTWKSLKISDYVTYYIPFSTIPYHFIPLNTDAPHKSLFYMDLHWGQHHSNHPYLKVQHFGSLLLRIVTSHTVHGQKNYSFVATIKLHYVIYSKSNLFIT